MDRLTSGLQAIRETTRSPDDISRCSDGVLQYAPDASGTWIAAEVLLHEACHRQGPEHIGCPDEPDQDCDADPSSSFGHEIGISRLLIAGRALSEETQEKARDSILDRGQRTL